MRPTSLRNRVHLDRAENARVITPPRPIPATPRLLPWVVGTWDSGELAWAGPPWHSRLVAVVAVGLAGCRGWGTRAGGCPAPGPVTGLVDREPQTATVPVLDLAAATPPITAPPATPAAHRPFNILVLSAGGADGAYPAGVLVGWSDAGTRPQFDVVTGVSTGALVAHAGVPRAGATTRI